MSTEPEYVRVGSVTRSHGLKGQVVVDVAAGMEALLGGVTSLWVRGGGGAAGIARDGRLTLNRAQRVGQSLVLRFDELRRREESDRLRGAELWALRSEIELPEGEIATEELLGMAVRLEDGTPLGRLDDVWQTGANDVFVVRGERGEWLLPATEEVVQELDLEGRVATVRLLPGMEPSAPGSAASSRPRSTPAATPASSASLPDSPGASEREG